MEVVSYRPWPAPINAPGRPVRRVSFHPFVGVAVSPNLPLTGRRLVLGVSGGIAAYKSAELVRRLRALGAEVRVVMTEGARAFVTPLTFQALSGQRVACDLLDHEAEAAMGHIELARWAELVLVAPASANLMARLAHGFADDLLSTLCLATTAPVWLAPAMNQAMWRAPATRANADLLARNGVTLLGPAEGVQACGESGPGRMEEPEAVAQAVVAHFSAGPLSGRKVVVTAGPTREAIDPVRYISNRSSGKMGYAVAEAARALGAEVVLVSGPTALPCPAGVERLEVESARQMLEAVEGALDGCDIFIAAAAVADYRPAAPAREKIKKKEERLALPLDRTEDILATVAARTPRPFCVGFAAETERVEAHAREKLARKGLDLIAANRVGPNLGFDRDDNALTLIWNDGERPLPRAPKRELARQLMETVIERYHAKD